MNTEEVTLIKADGTRKEFTATYGVTVFMTHDTSIHFEAGDEIERPIPTGLERFEITDPAYFTQMGGHWQLSVVKKGIRPKHAPQTVINLSGPGARMYQNSQDHSTNTVTVNSQQTFAEIKKLIRQHADGDMRAGLMERIESIEKSGDKPTASLKFSEFMSFAANATAVWGAIAPCIPAISRWVTSLPGGS